MDNFQKEPAIEGKWYVVEKLRAERRSDTTKELVTQTMPLINRRVDGPYDTRQEAVEVKLEKPHHENYCIGRVECAEDGSMKILECTEE